jgi:hypothetical protein
VLLFYIMDYEEEDLLSAAAVAVTIVSVCAAELATQKGKRKIWVKRLFQRRQSKGSYSSLLRELRDEDPYSFRAYLRMDIDTFDYLLDLLTPHISGSERYRKPIPAREILAVTLRYLATGIGYAYSVQ